MSDPKFYAEFSWAVPKAFAAAVHACRFEQGDVLYSDSKAYDTSSRAEHPAQYHVQVLDPPRTNRATAGDGEGQRFYANWESPVTFEWMDYKNGERREQQSTQGRLFACLWRGEVEPLLDLNADGPERPCLLRDLAADVDSYSEALLAKLGEKPINDADADGKPAKRHLFAIAMDQSSDTSRSKCELIERSLAAHFDVAAQSYSPVELGLAAAGTFHPTLRVFGATIKTADANRIEAVLRDVLYAGGKAPGQEGGRFNLSRHGRLVGLS
jgi:hypothetical protein